MSMSYTDCVVDKYPHHMSKTVNKRLLMYCKYIEHKINNNYYCKSNNIYLLVHLQFYNSNIILCIRHGLSWKYRSLYSKKQILLYTLFQNGGCLR